jgi:hypothetical protein
MRAIVNNPIMNLFRIENLIIRSIIENELNRLTKSKYSRYPGNKKLTYFWRLPEAGIRVDGFAFLQRIERFIQAKKIFKVKNSKMINYRSGTAIAGTKG